MRMPLSLSDTHTAVSVCVRAALCAVGVHTVCQAWEEDTSWQSTLSAGPSDWGARQARAGSRRIKRLFGGRPDATLTLPEFVGGTRPLEAAAHSAQPSKQASRRKQAAAHDRTPPHTPFPSLFFCPSPCTVLESEYDKRLARGGLTLNRAISEVESNMPQRAIYAELYGQE